MKLEQNNFKIDSTGWKKINVDGVIYLENPENDVCELENGEQLFTWDAAIRETKKAGKRMPTDEEFKKLVKIKDDIHNLTFSGARNPNLNYYDRRCFVWYWSSTESDNKGFRRSIYVNNSCVNYCDSNDDFSYSVRCIK